MSIKIGDKVSVNSLTDIGRGVRHTFYGIVDSFDREEEGLFVVKIYSIDQPPNFSKSHLGFANFGYNGDIIKIIN